MTAPRRPADVDDRASFAALVAEHDAHTGPLVAHRVGIGEQLDAGQVAEHALAALALKHALAERLLAHRWLTASEALAAGATLDDVAVACGFTVDEVRAGVRSWADGQAHLHQVYGSFGMTPAEAEQVRALVAEPGR